MFNGPIKLNQKVLRNVVMIADGEWKLLSEMGDGDFFLLYGNVYVCNGIVDGNLYDDEIDRMTTRQKEEFKITERVWAFTP